MNQVGSKRRRNGAEGTHPRLKTEMGVGEVSEPTGYEINGIGEGSGRNSGETSPRGRSIAEPSREKVLEASPEAEVIQATGNLLGGAA